MKRPDVIETWKRKSYTKANPEGVYYYYFHRLSPNGEILFFARYKTLSGRAKAIKRIMIKEAITLRKRKR